MSGNQEVEPSGLRAESVGRNRLSWWAGIITAIGLLLFFMIGWRTIFRLIFGAIAGLSTLAAIVSAVGALRARGTERRLGFSAISVGAVMIALFAGLIIPKASRQPSSSEGSVATSGDRFTKSETAGDTRSIPAIDKATVNNRERVVKNSSKAAEPPIRKEPTRTLPGTHTSKQRITEAPDPVVDLRHALTEGGFSLQSNARADQLAIEDYLRYGTSQNAQKAKTGDQFDRIEAEKAFEDGRDKIRDSVYLLSDLQFVVPRDLDIQKEGLILVCNVPIRFHPRPKQQIDERQNYTPSLDSLRLTWLEPGIVHYWFLTKQQTLMRTRSQSEAHQIERAEGILYVPEDKFTQIRLVLSLSLDEAKQITRNQGDYKIDVVLENLRREQAISWGYFMKKCLVNDKYDGELTFRLHDVGLDEAGAPAYFAEKKDQSAMPWIVTADLVSVTLRDKGKHSIAAYSRPSTHIRFWIPGAR